MVYFRLNSYSHLLFAFSNDMHQLQDKESMFSTWLHGKQFISFPSFLSLVSPSLSLSFVYASLNDMNFFFSASFFVLLCMRVCVRVYIRVTSARKNYIKLFQSQHIRQRFNLFYFRCSALLLHLYIFSLSLLFLSVDSERMCVCVPLSIPLG